MARYYDLPRGPRVCLRLARLGDLPGLEGLFEREGLAVDGLELARLVRSDPRRRLVLCAAGLVAGVPTLVGVGALDLESGELELLVVDSVVTDGLGELLAAALRGRAEALAARRSEPFPPIWRDPFLSLGTSYVHMTYRVRSVLGPGIAG